MENFDKPMNSTNNSEGKSSSQNKDSVFRTPVKPEGIHAVQIKNAKEMFLMTTRSRQIPHKIQGSKIPITSKLIVTNKSFENSSIMPTNVSRSPFTNPNIQIPAKSHSEHCKNPQCSHCGSVIIPAPASSYPIKDTPSISIDDWEIFTMKQPILNAEMIDHFEEKLSLPLPEMIFGKNQLKIKNSKFGWEIIFNSIDAIDTVLKIGCDPNKLLKVAHSNKWFNHKKKNSANKNNSSSLENLSSDLYDTEIPTDKINDNVTKMIKPYDWTYTPYYKGTLPSTNKFEFKSSTKQIPIDKLTRPDPILFFDDIVLYEDELADNGIAILQVKIRVMEKRLLLLSRFFLRIDDVIFKIKDVRIYIEFEDNLIIRDVKEQEDTYQNVYNKVLRMGGGGDPRFYLRDSNWVSKHLKTVFHEVEETQLE